MWTRDNYGFWARSIGHRRYLEIVVYIFYITFPTSCKMSAESEMFSSKDMDARWQGLSIAKVGWRIQKQNTGCEEAKRSLWQLEKHIYVHVFVGAVWASKRQARSKRTLAVATKKEIKPKAEKKAQADDETWLAQKKMKREKRRKSRAKWYKKDTPHPFNGEVFISGKSTSSFLGEYYE